MRTHYTTKDVLRATSIKRERFMEWVTLGYVSPDVPSEGRGKAAKYSKETIYLVGLLRVLIDSGFKRNIAKEMVNSFKIKTDFKPDYTSDMDTVSLVVFEFNWAARGERNISKTILKYEDSDDITRLIIGRDNNISVLGVTQSYRENKKTPPAPHGFYTANFGMIVKEIDRRLI